ncbi:unnamed protein product [Ambrosiozyma monospora]|uniref:Unnamed protein product n=1 Tax=Ambrosiozyma monospora TaxID=43982 RepID=A0A9W6Z460_AMBMO|nr:unnamed protein product [Ambrosiozyma monospora]
MNNIPGLRNLTIKLDPLDDIPDTNNLIEISNLSVVNLMFSSNWPQTSIYFSGLSSTLKRIYLQNCTLTADFFNTLPDSVELISFYMVCLEKTFDRIRMPTCLNTLIIKENPHFKTLPAVTNIKQLNNLYTVVFDLANGIPMETVQCIILELPTSVEELTLINDDDPVSNFQDDDYNYNYINHPDELSYTHLKSLRKLSFSSSCFESSNFDLSKLPPVETLQFRVFPSLSGQFSDTLQMLDLNLQLYNGSFTSFWNLFIYKLDKLLRFKAKVNSQGTIDLREISFSSHLVSFQLEFLPMGYNHSVYAGRLIINNIPSSLKFFGLCAPFYSSEGDYVIFVDQSLGESVESLKDKIVMFPPVAFQFTCT